MNIEKMFIILVNIVLITLMLLQPASVLGYMYTIIFVFVEIVLLLTIIFQKRILLEGFYLLLCVVLGFVFLVVYLYAKNVVLTTGLGYLLIAAFFIALVITGVSKKQSRPQIEVYDSTHRLEKPRPPKKNVFDDVETKRTKRFETDLKRQAKALEDAEKKLSSITSKLSRKSTKKKASKKKTSTKSKKKKASKKKAGKKGRDNPGLFLLLLVYQINLATPHGPPPGARWAPAGRSRRRR